MCPVQLSVCVQESEFTGLLRFLALENGGDFQKLHHFSWTPILTFLLDKLMVYDEYHPNKYYYVVASLWKAHFPYIKRILMFLIKESGLPDIFINVLIIYVLNKEK